MELITFKTLWGHPQPQILASLEQACDMAVKDGFQGIEGQAPRDARCRNGFAALLAEYRLGYISEICTAGSYVPDRSASVRDHLDDLALQLELLAPLNPLKVNCIGGCDRWSLAQNLAFFDSALELADKAGIAIAFETHRGRSLYSPWVAAQLLEKMSLPLTCDFSHWCVVCEGLGESEDDLMRDVAQHAVHTHGRIGYDQGPQINDPKSPRYQADVERHLRWWGYIWESHYRAGHAISTLTPEFGPDGYQMIDPASDIPVGDLNDMNRRVATLVRTRFAEQLGTVKPVKGGSCHD